MTRPLVIGLILAFCLANQVQGAPAVVVAKKPSLASPQTDLGNAGLQARYAKMWEDYSSAVGEASKNLQAEIETQAKSATRAANLNLALFWKGVAKEFEQKTELRWDEAALKKGWGERFGGASFPKSFSVAVGNASATYASAIKELEKHYGELVTEITKTEQLELALKIRGELKALIAENSPQQSLDSMTLKELRTGGFRGKLSQAGGGNLESEASVEAALKWLISHQKEDGGWSFDLSTCPECNGQCRSTCHASWRPDRGGATGLALLPFLARGYTSKTGPYKKQLGNAENFLTTLSLQNNGNLIKAGGNLSSQAYATLAMSECELLAGRKKASQPLRLALDFILKSDKDGPGWEAVPSQPADTVTTACVMSVLQSVRSFTPTPVDLAWPYKRTVDFLNQVQSEGGARYGLFAPEDAPRMTTSTSAGLAVRVDLGWRRDNAALHKGIDFLATQGPSDDMLHNYYATQLMHHVEGDRWIAWNTKMRDLLVHSLCQEGHASGSWFDGFDKSKDAQQMGRLYVTSLATLILEVYYRYPPPSKESSP